MKLEKIFSYMEKQRKSRKQQEKPTLVLKIHQNYLRLRQCYMIYAKENFLLLNTSTLSVVIGNT